MDVHYTVTGAMKKHPLYHHRSGLPYTQEEDDYLINWWGKVGAEEFSFALGRTEGSIRRRAERLMSKGLLDKTRLSADLREIKGGKLYV